MARLVTVFGGSGFIGRYAVRQLARQGWRVNVAVRDAEGAKFLRTAGEVGQVTPLAVSVRDAKAVAAALVGAEAAVNLTGILHESGSQKFDAIHHRGAATIAEAAARAGVSRLVHVSAIGADPQSPAAYARSKAAGEAAVRAAFPAATILRPSVVFGPEDAFFNRFAAMALISPALPLIGGGRTRFQPVYVGDVAEAVCRALADPAAAGQTYELGGPSLYTFRELMELLLAQIHRRRCLVSLPFGLARLQATFLQMLPSPLLTVDQVRMLERDNVVTPGMQGLAELGIQPTALDAVLPTYLDRFRAGGRFPRAA